MRFQNFPKIQGAISLEIIAFNVNKKQISVDNKRIGSPPPPTHTLLLKSTGLPSHYITPYKLESDDKDFLNYLKI